MVQIDLKFNSQASDDLIARRKARFSDASPRLKKALLELRKDVRLSIKDKAKRFSGKLARSWDSAIFLRTKDTVAGHVFTESVYSRQVDQGGVIKAKHARNLSIPLTGRARKAGSPRNFGNLFFVISKAGNKLLVEKVGKRIKPHYVLKPSVRQEGIKYLEPAHKKWIDNVMREGFFISRSDR